MKKGQFKNIKLSDLRDVYELGNLKLLARQVVEGFIVGMHKSPFHGFSVEFAEHRQYNTGESTQNIDWKVYARTERLYVKRYEEETNLRCQILIDCSSSMFYPQENKNPVETKIGFSVIAASAIMQLLKKQRDAFGLTLFSDKIDLHTHSKSTTVHHHFLLSQLENMLHDSSGHQKTAAARSLHQTSEAIHRRSLAIIFSDMFDRMENKESLFSALQHFKHNKHEVILFHVTDKQKELDFEFENRPYIFEDIETGEKVKVRSSDVKEYYVEQIRKYKKELELKCGQYKIDFVEADINKPFRQILLPYLMKRKRMM